MVSHLTQLTNVFTVSAVLEAVSFSNAYYLAMHVAASISVQMQSYHIIF